MPVLIAIRCSVVVAAVKRSSRERKKATYVDKGSDASEASEEEDEEVGGEILCMIPLSCAHDHGVRADQALTRTALSQSRIWVS